STNASATFAPQLPKWKAALSSVSRSFNMSGELTNQPSKEEPEFVRQVAAKAARKLRVQQEGKQGVWFDRLVGRGADASRGDARPLVGATASGSAFLDANAAGRWIVHRLR